MDRGIQGHGKGEKRFFLEIRKGCIYLFWPADIRRNGYEQKGREDGSDKILGVFG
jgi:hypothetical protein